MEAIGQFRITSSSGRLVQAHDDGEMHASQDLSQVGEEERWNLYVWPDGKVSFENYRTNRFLGVNPNGCPRADRGIAGDTEKWIIHATGDHATVGLMDSRGHWLTAHTPGANAGTCGGECEVITSAMGSQEHFQLVPSNLDAMPKR
jgi:hypothetical protein